MKEEKLYYFIFTRVMQTEHHLLLSNKIILIIFQAIPHAIAMVRSSDKKSPREAVEFILQLLKVALID